METVRTWQLQYGFDADRFAQVSASGADLVVMETALTSRTPPAELPLSRAELDALRDAGQTVVGYVNVAVTDHRRTYWQADGADWTDPDPDDDADEDIYAVTDAAPQWLRGNRGEVDFDFDGDPDGIIANYQDADWQQIVLDQATAIVEAGYHGVFLDDVQRYFEAGHFGPEPFDPAWAVAIMRLVVRIHDAVTAIDPDAYVVINGGPNLLIEPRAVFETGLAPGDPLFAAFRGAFDAILLENQFVNEGMQAPIDQQDVLSEAAGAFTDKVILSVETGEAAIDVAGYLAFCARAGILPFLPGDGSYKGFAGPVQMGGNDADRIRLVANERAAAGLGGADTLRGGDGDDLLFGHGGRDRVVAGAGDDTVEGGSGKDRLAGGAGADVFVLRPGDGRDTIADFIVGEDTLRLVSGAAGLDDLDFVVVGDALVVTFDSVSVRLVGVGPGALEASDFIFG